MDGQFYFSKGTIEDCIWCGGRHMTFFFVPNKWWSLSDWKMAFDMRKNFYLTGIIRNGAE